MIGHKFQIIEWDLFLSWMPENENQFILSLFFNYSSQEKNNLDANDDSWANKNSIYFSFQKYNL